MSNWQPISELKETDGTVWLFNEKDGSVKLGCLVYLHNEGFFISVSNGVIYPENGRIISECEMDDDYEFTHFHKLPELPKIKDQ